MVTLRCHLFDMYICYGSLLKFFISSLKQKSLDIYQLVYVLGFSSCESLGHLTISYIKGAYITC